MPDHVIRIMCPNLRCRSILAVPTEARGRMVRCRNCGTNIKVPAKPEQAKPAETPEASKPAESKPAA